ncbi:MAG: prepilin-type N-terminal cleavage/methylation domain-containing protein [Candidatus Faecisoma sp.]|nr:prepilin-type N-terminal cleavage/methylation domain-containing protein [Acholeplasma sp.]MDY2892206.1 prepilin-type N-terminal cleavage/methylation domain-containing protein [Candidatus Faecisoma sp.]
MKNKKKKGFTLIELLAVIIVLAIIALIATPIIFNVIENAKIKSLENSCYGVIDAIRTKYAEGLLNLNKITNGNVNELTVSGEKPIAGTWTIYNSKDSVEKGIKIEGVKFASMKDYVCTNVNSDGTINSNVTCTKENDVSSEPILKEKLLGTNDSNVVTSGDGLYSKTTSTGTTYYFKGAVENNYVKFADKVWRIVRINEDGTMRLITQDNVISSQKFNSAYNTYDKMYYTNSEIKTAVENWYKTNISDKGFDEKVVNGNYFCEQAKVVYNTNYTAGSATVATKDNYTPSFDCTTDGNGKGVVSGKVGLITIDEVLFAGGVIGSNSNFYLKNGSAYCMMSPAGFYTYNDYARAWGVVSAGRIGDFHVASNYGVRPVINLSADTLVTGSGTSSDPYVVKS